MLATAGLVPPAVMQLPSGGDAMLIVSLEQNKDKAVEVIAILLAYCFFLASLQGASHGTSCLDPQKVL